MLSADPRLVPQTRVLEELSFNEAIELAYFGAEVIHPATMGPAIEDEIPIYIRNAFNPSAPGTRIHASVAPTSPVKGLASIGDMALINLEGTAMIGVPGISERLFRALREAEVSVVMISQGSSEHSICFATLQSEVHVASRAIEEAFESETRYGQIQPPTITQDCTILAVVGDGMAGTPGIAANSSSVRSKKASERSASYPLSSGEIANVTTLSVRIPRSTRLTFTRLLINSPADASSVIERASWAVTNPLRNRAAARAPEGWPVLAFNIVTRSGRVLCRAG